MASIGTQTELSAQNFDQLVRMRQTACVRDGTATTSVVASLLPTERMLPISGGLFDALEMGAQNIRAGECAGMTQPLWMAESALISERANPGASCDLRLQYPVFKTANGGYITSATWLRRQALEKAVAGGAPPASPGAECSSVVSDVLGVLMKDMMDSDLRKIRNDQLERMHSNTCRPDGTNDPEASTVDVGPKQGLTVTNYAGLLSTTLLLLFVSFLFSPPILRRIRNVPGLFKHRVQHSTITNAARGQRQSTAPAEMTTTSAMHTYTNNELAAKLDSLEAMLVQLTSEQKPPAQLHA